MKSLYEDLSYKLSRSTHQIKIIEAHNLKIDVLQGYHPVTEGAFVTLLLGNLPSEKEHEAVKTLAALDREKIEQTKARLEEPLQYLIMGPCFMAENGAVKPVNGKEPKRNPGRSCAQPTPRPS